MKRFGYSMMMFSMFIVSLFIYNGCDVTDPTFIVDTALEAEVLIDEEGNTFSESTQLNLQSLIDEIDGQIGDINVFNVTLKIDRLGNTPQDLLLSGSIGLNEYTLVSMGDLPISLFAEEQSIFDDDLLGQYDFTVDPDGLTYLLSLMNDLPTVTVSVAGEASGEPVNILVTTKLHVQVTTE